MTLLYNFDDIYKKDDSVALFDYTAKTVSQNLSKTSCSNVDCFEGIMNPPSETNCMDYRQCLQYFNTLPIVNCIDNVPVPYFIALQGEEDTI